ncbi:MAG: MurR/RpiR family transcriptional regulator [Lachnospiraceae bacterium]|nr:MurR/RpiR family transcriptional regulator [Candidatus Equihabitans merdae]
MKRSAEIYKRVLDHDMNLLEQTRNEMNPDVFNNAVEMIARASRIYIVGVRNCAPLAEYLSIYLNQIFDGVELVRTNSASDIFEQMLHIKPKDVVIGISFPRYSMRVLKAMEFANSRSAGIITLTDSIHSPICLYSSCNLLAQTEMSTVVDSMTAPFSVINALVVALCAKKKKQVQKNVEELESIWNDFPVNSPDELNPADPDVKMKKTSRK